MNLKWLLQTLKRVFSRTFGTNVYGYGSRRKSFRTFLLLGNHHNIRPYSEKTKNDLVRKFFELINFSQYR